MMDMLGTMVLDKPLWMWLIFGAVVLGLLIIDLWVHHNRTLNVKENLLLSAFFILVGLVFGTFVWLSLGGSAARDYLTGYIVEQSLSVDNVFVISAILGSLAIPHNLQHRVLRWGIGGVIVLRGLMFGIGAALIAEFEWVLYLFAAFLLYTGANICFAKEKETGIEGSKLLSFLKKHFNVTRELYGSKFLVKLPSKRDPKRKILFFTPLMLALVMIGFADIIFAVDSVPAIFAITRDLYIIFTSNLFAILGLWALYFSLSAMVERFKYLKPALGLVLIFIGAKVFAPLLGLGKMPSWVSLAITVGVLAGGIGYSLFKTAKEKNA